ncbi:MAG TPA: penicillin acylase family protein, partial [Gemmatimonadaceae bacterium]
IDDDREMRRLGLPRAAEARYARLAADAPDRRAVEAYADGVNAFLDGLERAAWPVEYKLLGRAPERWRPANSFHLFSRMGWTLAWDRTERTLLAVAGMVGMDAARSLFPLNDPIQEPIQPNGSRAPRFDFARLEPPGAPDTLALRLAEALPRGPGEGPIFASNNWAVAPRRSATGHALLAGDPHLELTLPSIWYEAHLVVPGELDVYGVTIPGAPGIVIGFTRDVAWSFTNTGADVLDYFRETVDDTAAPRRYRLDGEWRDLEITFEPYHGRDGEVLAVDTIRYTHRGPLTRLGSDWVSMRWTVLESPLDTRIFVRAARATSARAFLDAMARGWGAPAQNMIVADRHGSIAIRSTGEYPLRANGNGLDILDGSVSANDWRGFWPLERYPQAFDPPQGYLASANQQPIDPHEVPTYLGHASSFEPWRALHINALLRRDSAVTVDAMRRYQTDPGSARADLFLPFFLDAAARVIARGNAPPALDTAAALLGEWNRQYTKDNERALLFEAAMRQLTPRTWDELVRDGRRVATPSASVLLELLHDSASAWWDDRRTPERVEHRDEIVAASLVAAYDSLVRHYGPPSSGAWRWDRRMTARVMHLLGIPSFSAPSVPAQGGPETLNPVSGSSFGASWRMVVELGDEVRAWGTYPGGQSGHPASSRYMDRLPLWSEGVLDTLFTPRDSSMLQDGAPRLTLVPAGRAP